MQVWEKTWLWVQRATTIDVKVTSVLSSDSAPSAPKTPHVHQFVTLLSGQIGAASTAVTVCLLYSVLLACSSERLLDAPGFYFPSHSKQWSGVVRGPSADVHSFKAAALEMPISSAAQRRSFPFSVLLLSSSIVSLWGSLFRGIHASAFGPQWPPLYKLSACLPQAFGSYCFLFFNKLGGVHQLLQCSLKITDGPPSPLHFFFLLFFLLAAVCVSAEHVWAPAHGLFQGSHCWTISYFQISNTSPSQCCC